MRIPRYVHVPAFVLLMSTFIISESHGDGTVWDVGWATAGALSVWGLMVWLWAADRRWVR